MFDYHLHSSVSFDSSGNAKEMAQYALKSGIKEICFTDHYDYNSDATKPANLFTIVDYNAAYDSLQIPGLKVRKGVEFGLTAWNKPQLDELLKMRDFDFVIGSVHFIEGFDPYEEKYWEGKSVEEAFLRYLEGTLECVRMHDDFDVLGHLTYVCKSVHNPVHKPVFYKDYKDISDEIMKVLIHKGIGMEINTSGVGRVKEFLPSADFLRRYKELGGEIVTVGSDAHDSSRVGEYVKEAMEIAGDIFGYVCTFENRKAVFHKVL